jgi:hypothetical protein
MPIMSSRPFKSEPHQTAGKVRECPDRKEHQTDNKRCFEVLTAYLGRIQARESHLKFNRKYATTRQIKKITVVCWNIHLLGVLRVHEFPERRHWPSAASSSSPSSLLHAHDIDRQQQQPCMKNVTGQPYCNNPQSHKIKQRAEAAHVPRTCARQRRSRWAWRRRRSPTTAAPSTPGSCPARRRVSWRRIRGVLPAGAGLRRRTPRCTRVLRSELTHTHFPHSQ